MPIKTTNLELQAVDQKNLGELAHFLAKPGVNEWAEAIQGLSSQEIQETIGNKFCNPKKPDYYACIYKNDKFIGFVSLEKDDSDHYFYLDVYIDPKHHKKGYGTEAVMEGLMQYVTKNPEIKKVAMNILSKNTKALGLYKKLEIKARDLKFDLKFNETNASSSYLSSFKKVCYGAAIVGVTGLLFYWKSKKSDATPVSATTFDPHMKAILYRNRVGFKFDRH